MNKIVNSNITDNFDKYIYTDSSIKREFEKWYSELIQNYLYKSSDQKSSTTDTMIQKCCSFFTMTFRTSEVIKEKERLGLSRDDFSVELDTFQLLYCTIAERLFGKGWAKQKFEKKLPYVILCVDFEGSRMQHSLPMTPKNVHLHAIWLIHPDETDKFNGIINGLHFRQITLNSLRCDKVEWEPYLKAKSKVEKLGSYATKLFIKSTRNALPGELFRIYPNSNYGGRPYRAANTYKRTDKMLDKLRRASRRDVSRRPITQPDEHP
jgi:hypothetical protein